MFDQPLPSSKDVRDLLSDLLGRDVTVAQEDAPATAPAADSTVAVYRDDARNLVAIVVTDLALSGHLGAALALMSKDTVAEAVADRSLPAVLAENAREVLSIVGTLFNGHRPVRLADVHLPGEAVPMQISAHSTALGRRRMDLDVAVPGYGSGQMSVVV